MKIHQLLIIAALLLQTTVYSQGEGLFKTKCNTCHAVDKNSTGPWLKGVKAKWTDAGEGTALYEWVRNSKSVIAGGKSKMALAIKDFSGSEMPPQQATNEEIDQILDYIDTYTPPLKTDVTGPTTEKEVKLLPDYKGNLTIFYALGTLTIILLLAIILMSNSILSFVKSDVFKQKLKDQQNLTKLLVILISLGAVFFPGYSYGMSTPDPTNPTEAGYPWLLVEKFDLYVVVGINLVLLIIVLYLRGLFNDFYYMVYPRKVKAAKQPQKRVVKILVDSVPIEEESSILMDHEYDGIRELDNNLPPWWVWGFYASIVFAFIYILNYHLFDTGDLQTEEYNKSMVQAQKEIDQYLKEAAMNVDENTVTLLTDQSAIGSGKQLFEANCTACHKDGSGDIGPNLTDNFWLYGNDIKTVFGTIKNGTSNGMPEHASKLNPVQLQQVASYVLSMKYKPGKEPQGKEFPKK